MFIRELERLEAEFYREVNQIVEPLVRAGFGSPGLWPAGVIVVEIRGRKTGRTLNVPLLATLVGNFMLVSTVRRRSQWLKNLAVNPDVRYWRGGRIGTATAVVFARGPETLRLNHLPPMAGCLATALRPYNSVFGGGVAVLIPTKEQATNRHAQCGPSPHTSWGHQVSGPVYSRTMEEEVRDDPTCGHFGEVK